jgi:hypothetical protein
MGDGLKELERATRTRHYLAARLQSGIIRKPRDSFKLPFRDPGTAVVDGVLPVIQEKPGERRLTILTSDSDRECRSIAHFVE